MGFLEDVQQFAGELPTHAAQGLGVGLGALSAIVAARSGQLPNWLATRGKILDDPAQRANLGPFGAGTLFVGGKNVPEYNLNEGADLPSVPTGQQVFQPNLPPVSQETLTDQALKDSLLRQREFGNEYTSALAAQAAGVLGLPPEHRFAPPPPPPPPVQPAGPPLAVSTMGMPLYGGTPQAPPQVPQVPGMASPVPQTAPPGQTQPGFPAGPPPTTTASIPGTGGAVQSPAPPPQLPITGNAQPPATESAAPTQPATAAAPGGARGGLGAQIAERLPAGGSYSIPRMGVTIRGREVKEFTPGTEKAPGVKIVAGYDPETNVQWIKKDDPNAVQLRAQATRIKSFLDTYHELFDKDQIDNEGKNWGKPITLLEDPSVMQALARGTGILDAKRFFQRYFKGDPRAQIFMTGAPDAQVAARAVGGDSRMTDTETRMMVNAFIPSGRESPREFANKIRQTDAFFTALFDGMTQRSDEIAAVDRASPAAKENNPVIRDVVANAFRTARQEAGGVEQPPAGTPGSPVAPGGGIISGQMTPEEMQDTKDFYTKQKR